ncbi:MAG: tetratricopeptide repeat protein [Rickettsiales bacterium]
MNIFSYIPKTIINFLSEAATPYTLKLEKQLKNHYIKVINENPKDSDAYNNLGVLNFEFGNYSQSLKDLSKAISINSQYHHHIHFFCSAIYTYLGHIHLIKKDKSGANSFYEKAIFQDHQNKEAAKFHETPITENPSFHSSKYFINVALDFDYQQISNLKYKNILTVLSKKDASLDDIVYKIDFLYQKSHFKDVIKFSEAAYKKYKYNKFLYYIACCHYHLKKYSVAQTFFEKYLSKENSNESALYDYGYCLLAQQKWKDSERIFAKLLKKTNNDFVLFAYGIAAFFQEKYSIAKKYLNKSLKSAKIEHEEYHTNSSNQYYNRAYIFYQSQQYDIALSDLAKSIDLQKDNIDALTLTAKILYKKKNYAEALMNCDKILQLNRDIEEIHQLKTSVTEHLRKGR